MFHCPAAIKKMTESLKALPFQNLRMVLLLLLEYILLLFRLPVLVTVTMIEQMTESLTSLSQEICALSIYYVTVTAAVTVHVAVLLS